MSNELTLYMHAGSGNHGCEAIVRGFMGALRAAGETGEVRLITHSAEQDRKYLPSGLCRIEQERAIDEHFAAHVLYYAWRKVTGDRESFQRYRFPMLQGDRRPAVAVSIGGDNYCYPDMVPDLILADRMLQRRGTATVLMGCSVEPQMLEKDPALAEAMRAHTLILARESLTYEALLAAGVERERIRLLPDPAFVMEPQEGTIPDGFVPGGTVGINVSPLIENYRAPDGTGTVKDAFGTLIDHVIRTTDLQVALIPHVIWPSSNDLEPLASLNERFRGTGRVVCVADQAAPLLKSVIARCRFFIGARTHATIAAYSSMVPTLVAGYSVKSAGIARDLFGDRKDLVLPVSTLTGDKLVSGFEMLKEQEEELKALLCEKIPEVRERALKNAEEVMELVRKTGEKE